MPSLTPLGQTPGDVKAVLPSAPTPCPQNSGTNPSLSAYLCVPKTQGQTPGSSTHLTSPQLGAKPKSCAQCPPCVPTIQGQTQGLVPTPHSQNREQIPAPKATQLGINPGLSAHPMRPSRGQASVPPHLFLAVLTQWGQGPFAAAAPPVGGPSWFLEFAAIWVEQPHPLRAAHIVPATEPWVMKASLLHWGNFGGTSTPPKSRRVDFGVTPILAGRFWGYLFTTGWIFWLPLPR